MSLQLNYYNYLDVAVFYLSAVNRLLNIEVVQKYNDAAVQKY